VLDCSNDDRLVCDTVTVAWNGRKRWSTARTLQPQREPLGKQSAGTAQHGDGLRAADAKRSLRCGGGRIAVDSRPCP